MESFLPPRAIADRSRDDLDPNGGLVARPAFAIGDSACYGRKEILWPGPASGAAAVRNELGNFLSHDRFTFARSPAAAIGALLGAATIPLNLLLSTTRSEQFTALLLAVIGAIYIGFSLQKGNRFQIATELTVALGFFAAALVGLWVTPWIVPVAYSAHGIWDYAYHHDSTLASVPVKLVA